MDKIPRDQIKINNPYDYGRVNNANFTDRNFATSSSNLKYQQNRDINNHQFKRYLNQASDYRLQSEIDLSFNYFNPAVINFNSQQTRINHIQNNRADPGLYNINRNNESAFYKNYYIHSGDIIQSESSREIKTIKENDREMNGKFISKPPLYSHKK